MRISDWSSDVCSSELEVGIIDTRQSSHAADRGEIGLSHIEQTIHYIRQEYGVGAAVGRVCEIRQRIGQCMDRVQSRTGIRERSEDATVGQECVSTCSSRWSTAR